MKKAIPLILLVAALGGGGWYFYQKHNGADDPLVLHGNVDIRGVDLGFRVSGRIAEVLKDEGDFVKAGELLARIDCEGDAGAGQGGDPAGQGQPGAGEGGRGPEARGVPQGRERAGAGQPGAGEGNDGERRALLLALGRAGEEQQRVAPGL
jgi:HlyD family secretion protein